MSGRVAVGGLDDGDPSADASDHRIRMIGAVAVAYYADSDFV